MAANSWTWAKLSDEQLGRLKQAEQTLGADILLAYQTNSQASRSGDTPKGLKATHLNPSQMECLQGLEDNLKAVVVAYARSA